ncbi:MAG: phosphoenolpyruvate--protein phosphotransferase [Spirochaetaceae bacterium]|nr:MAG: phosphoenolpyruvate--protein phosphotransferase [Spirochaetaceae bacterium]
MKHEQETQSDNPQLVLHGIAGSRGISIGKVLLVYSSTGGIPQYEIDDADIDDELERFKAAVGMAIKAIDLILSGKKDSAGAVAESEANHHAVLESHRLMLQDPDFHERVASLAHISHQNIEWIVHLAIKELTDKLGAARSEYLRERISDLQDIERRLLNQLLGRELPDLKNLGSDKILVCDDLLPSDAICMDKRHVLGVAMDHGGKTSHTAILTRAFEIPSVLGLGKISSEAKHDDIIIIDGNSGVVVLRPDSKTLKEYQQRQKDWQKREVRLMRLTQLPAETRDGKLIHLKANIEIPEEVDSVISHGADGVGLYRSEFLFLQSAELPDEDSQYEIYSRVLESLPGRPVTIRTLDLGGDKLFAGRLEYQEKNPILGWRAIRMCLAEKELFRTQLRALLRASAHGNLRIMFPMISGLDELNQAIAMYQSVRAELVQEAVPMAASIPIGVMIEIPSAAMISDILARKVDFFSVGTNDLIQYTLAVDRGNEKVAYLYEPFHPAVLRMLMLIIKNAHANAIPVAMCGEMASDPLAALILLGLGLDEFSMGAVAIPEVKQIIRSVTLLEAEELVGTIMDMKTHEEIYHYISQLMEKRFEYSINNQG